MTHERSNVTTMTEIERKFLLTALPPVPDEAETLGIEQGYLPEFGAAGDDSGDHVEGRLRRITRTDGSQRFTRTIKRGEGLVREETNHELTREQFERLWPSTERRRLTKTRRRLPLGEVLWEIDVIHELDVVLAEIELPSADHPYEIPEWLRPCVVREVTGEPAFTNFELALKAIAQQNE